MIRFSTTKKKEKKKTQINDLVIKIILVYSPVLPHGNGYISNNEFVHV